MKEILLSVLLPSKVTILTISCKFDKYRGLKMLFPECFLRNFEKKNWLVGNVDSQRLCYSFLLRDSLFRVQIRFLIVAQISTLQSTIWSSVRNHSKYLELTVKEHQIDEFLSNYARDYQLVKTDMEEYSDGIVRILKSISANMNKVGVCFIQT